MLMTFHEKHVKRIVYDGTRARNLPLRRRTPYPLGHADTIYINSNTDDHITFTHAFRITSATIVYGYSKHLLLGSMTFLL